MRRPVRQAKPRSAISDGSHSANTNSLDEQLTVQLYTSIGLKSDRNFEVARLVACQDDGGRPTARLGRAKQLQLKVRKCHVSI